MKLRAILSQSLIVQSLGAGLGFFAAIVISHRFGPSGQGLYATMRAWVDVASLVMLAGMPQALIHAISGGTLPITSAARFVVVFSIVASAAFWGITSLVPALAPPYTEPGVYALLVFAACCSTLYGLNRAMVLARGKMFLYNVATIAPSVVLFIAAILIATGDTRSFAAVLALTFGICAVFTVITVSDSLFKKAGTTFTWMHATGLMRYGSWSLVQQVAPQAAILGTYMGLKQGVTPDQLGFFSIAMVLLSMLTLPLSIVGPILFTRWAREFSTQGSSKEYELSASALLLLSAAVTIGALPTVYWGVPVVFGESFRPAVPICMVMAASTYLFVQRLMLLTAGLAFNMPRRCAAAEAWRAAVIVSLVALVPRLEIAVVAWLIGELVTIAYVTGPLAKRLDLPLHKVLGLNMTSLRMLRGATVGSLRR